MCVNSFKKNWDLSGVGFEPTPPFGDQKIRYHFFGKDKDFDFESDTLEGSAILTTHVREGSVKYCELILGGTICVNLQRLFWRCHS